MSIIHIGSTLNVTLTHLTKVFHIKVDYLKVNVNFLLN